MTSIENYKSATKTSLLLVGRPGEGKTTLALMLRNIYVVNIDNNIDGPIKFLLSKGYKPTLKFDTPNIDDKGVVVPREHRWRAMTAKINAAVDSWKEMETIFIDSLTGLVEYGIDEIKRQQGVTMLDPLKETNEKKKEGLFERQHWGTLAILLNHFFIGLRASGKNLVVSGHVNAEKDELEGYLREFINVPGKSRDDIARSFTECWRISKIAEGNPPVTKVYAETVATTTRTQTIGLKSALQLPAKWLVELDKIPQLLA